MDAQQIIDHTKRWISAVVIGLDLCPFAGRVFQGERIRHVVSPARDEPGLRIALQAELMALSTTPIETIETTLLIHPHVLTDFLDFNDFLDVADQLLVELDLEGVIQIASFHPDYRFADSEPDAVENFTNRSPYPMLHLLREHSISAIGAEADELLAIPRRNFETLRTLGRDKILALLEGIKPIR